MRPLSQQEIQHLIKTAKTSAEREYLVRMCMNRGWYHLLPPSAQRHPTKWIRGTKDEEVDV